MSLCWQKSVWSKLSHPLSSPSPPAFSLSQHQGLFQWVSSSHQVAKVLDDRGWDGWMATPTWWTWVWVSSGSWWWTGKSGVLQSMGSQRFGHDWATELNREIPVISILLFFKVVFESENKCRSVISDSFWPHGLYSPWNSLGQNTGVGSPSLLQGLFPTQGLNPGLLHCRQILNQLSHQGSPRFSLLLNNSTFYYE